MQYQQRPDGVVVIFQVVERPTLEFVTFVGNQDITSSTLKKKSELKAKDPLDPYAVEEARRRLEAMYREKGYSHIQITTLEGSKPGDRGARFLVDEGQSQRVSWTSFEGNTIASDSRLRTQIQTSRAFLWLFGGKVNRKTIDEDIDRLTAYYRGLGFFQAKVGYVPEYNADKNWLSIKFVINEGPRYSVRNVSFLGNEKFTNEELAKGLDLTKGKPFNQGALNKDLNTLRDIYGGHGYIFADVQADPRLDEDKPELDLVYDLKEGKRWRVGQIKINIAGENPHTSHMTILDRMSLRPGDIVDTRKIRDDERRLKYSGIFMNDPSKGSPLKIVFSKPADGESDENIANRNAPQKTAAAPIGYRGQSPDDEAEADLIWTRDAAGNEYAALAPKSQPDYEGVQVRFQSPDTGRAAASWSGYTAPQDQSTTIWGTSSAAPGTSSYLPAGAQPLPASRVASPYSATSQSVLPPVTPSSQLPSYTTPTAIAPTAAPAAPYFNAGYPARPAQASNAPVAGPPAGTPSYTPPGPQPQYSPVPGYPSQPAPFGQSYVPEMLPQPTTPPQQPFGFPGQPQGAPGEIVGVPPTGSDPIIPLEVEASETQTGRLMIGVGVNSDAGLVGNFVLDEQNFDITRLPHSWEDVRTGEAWRGGGEHLRLEANPGTVVQRYAATFQEPYLFETPTGWVQLSLSAYYFTRIYQDWTEGRTGGKIGLGLALTPDFSVRTGFRGESVDIYNPHVPTPPELTRVLGQNGIYGFSVGASHDTRDSPFIPTQGHLLSTEFEEVIGSFQYPRLDLQARQYWLVRQRPDGSGRHVFSLGGELGVTGSDTPIYDNFFPGGFSSLRGFAFRGAAPRDPVTGVVVGGQFELLGTGEYMFPITADDALRAVVFCDFGTAERTVRIDANQFRVAPGFGLRISVPAMGPAPIALDFAVPVALAHGDQVQNFSFFVGLGRSY
jgi:outer membrane protein insertion porin family